MSRQLTSGNLVVSGDRGTFEAAVTGFTPSTAFNVAQSTEQVYQGTYSALFTPKSITSTSSVFQNFTIAENIAAGTNLIVSCWIRQKAEGFMLNTDQILLEEQAGYTINSQTILTGSQVSSSEFVKLELDITATLTISKVLCRLKLQEPDGSPAPIQPVNAGLFVDTVEAYSYEDVTYTELLTHQFTSVNYGKQYQWQILEKNYEGSTTQITAGATPITYQNSIDAEFEEAVIIPGSCNGTVQASGINTYDFIQASDRKYLGVLKQHNGSEYVELWRGYSIPTNYQQEYASGSVALDLVFSDLLGDLKNKPFATDETINNRADIFGETLSTEIEIIGYCLQQLEVFEINTINVSISYQESAQTEDNRALDTYIDPSIFYEFNIINTTTTVTKSKTLAEVIQAILLKYTAKIIQWQGAYYITDFANQASETITYRQYDLFGVAKAGTNQVTENLVTHKAAGSSNHFRLMDRPSVVGTPSFKKIILELEGIIEETGMLTSMQKKLARLDSQGKFLGYGSTTSSSTYHITIFGQGYNGGTTPDIYVTKEGEVGSINSLFENGSNSPTVTGLTNTWLNIVERGSSPIYTKYLRIEGSTNLGDFTAESGDVLRLEFSVKDLTYLASTPSGRLYKTTETPPYYKLPFKVRVGNLYYNESAEDGQKWATNNVYNYRIITSPEDLEIDIEIDQSLSDELRVEIYGINATFYDVFATTEANMVILLKAESTSGLEEGDTIITKHSDSNRGGDFEKYYYYELINATASDASEPDKVVATDDSSLAWSLTETFEVIDNITRTTIGDIRLFYWPQGEKIDGKVTIERNGEPENIADYRSSLQLFDPPVVGNSKVLFKNITYRDDAGTPTESWEDSNGGTTRIQEHRAIELTKLLQQARYKITGSIHTDVDLSPLKQYKITEDGNRIMYPKNQILDFKNNRVEAEFTEIASDNVSTDISAHKTASHSAGHN